MLAYLAHDRLGLVDGGGMGASAVVVLISFLALRLRGWLLFVSPAAPFVVIDLVVIVRATSILPTHYNLVGYLEWT